MQPKDSAGVIPVPPEPSEYESLTKEILALQAEIARLTAERDYLKYHVCRELKAKYDSLIGALELELLQADGELRVLKLTLAMMQAAENRREEPDYEEADRQAREKYAAYEEDLNRRAEDIGSSAEYEERMRREEAAWEEEQAAREEAAKRAKQAAWEKEQTSRKEKRAALGDGDSSEGSSEEAPKYKSRSEELKALYRKIVKALHPDVNPNQTEEMRQMFRDAVEAYRTGDLNRLREIAGRLDSQTDPRKFRDTKEDILKLRSIRDELVKARDILLDEIREIQNSFPYTYKDFLADREAVAARQQELRDRIRWYKEQCVLVQERIRQMMKGEQEHGE